MTILCMMYTVCDFTLAKQTAGSLDSSRTSNRGIRDVFLVTLALEYFGECTIRVTFIRVHYIYNKNALNAMANYTRASKNICTF